MRGGLSKIIFKTGGKKIRLMKIRKHLHFVQKSLPIDHLYRKAKIGDDYNYKSILGL